MKSTLLAGLGLLIAFIESTPAQAATIGITYGLTGGLAGPPVMSGTTLILDGLDTGTILSSDPSLNALWNPVTFHDHSVVDLTTGLLNGTFSITFASGNMLSGNLFEDVTAAAATGGGPFTQRLTFTGGTGMFAGASGSASGAGVAGTTSFTSGSGTLTAPGIAAPEPASVALIFGGLIVLAARRKLVRNRTPIVNALGTNKFPGTTLALVPAVLMLLAGSRSAEAATIPFTFVVTYDTFLDGLPSPAMLIVPGHSTGSGSFAPFGEAIYLETGTINFAVLPSGGIVLSTVSLNFTASFNGGADTFTGTDFHVTGVSETLTILGGTGIFQGATGFAPATAVVDPPSGNPAPNYFGTVTSSGSGQITAPGLNAVPEPATLALLSTGLAGLLGVAAIRRRQRW